jgi:hypothetical protein
VERISEISDNRKKRIAVLRFIVNKILNGDFDLQYLDPHLVYKDYLPNRNQYFSPLDRSSYNYGYMTSGEIGAGNYGSQ